MNKQKNQLPGVVTPPSLTIVLDETNRVDRISLREKICAHLCIDKENINFCLTTGSKERVVENITDKHFNCVIYYQTPAGITELYKALVNDRKGKSVSQYHVSRRIEKKNGATKDPFIYVLVQANHQFKRLLREFTHQTEKEEVAELAA